MANIINAADEYRKELQEIQKELTDRELLKDIQRSLEAKAVRKPKKHNEEDQHEEQWISYEAFVQHNNDISLSEKRAARKNIKTKEVSFNAPYATYIYPDDSAAPTISTASTELPIMIDSGVAKYITLAPADSGVSSNVSTGYSVSVDGYRLGIDNSGRRHPPSSKFEKGDLIQDLSSGNFGIFIDSLPNCDYRCLVKDPKTNKFKIEVLHKIKKSDAAMTRVCQAKVLRSEPSAKVFKLPNVKASLVGKTVNIVNIERGYPCSSDGVCRDVAVLEVKDSKYPTVVTTKFLLEDVEIIKPSLKGLTMPKDRVVRPGDFVKVSYSKGTKLIKGDSVVVLDYIKNQLSSKAIPNTYKQQFRLDVVVVQDKSGEFHKIHRFNIKK